MKNYVLSLFLIFITCFSLYSKKFIVTVPVADLRNKKSITTDLGHLECDRAQLSQLCFGEQIELDSEVSSKVSNKEDKYLYVSSSDQLVYDKRLNKIIPCPGWIRSDQAIFVENFLDYNLVVKNKDAIVFASDKKTELLRVLLGTRFFGVISEDNFINILIPSNSKVNGYISGFIKKSDVFLYKDLSREEEDIRDLICQTAENFLGGSYTWGGRSIYDQELESTGQLTGVDCSNLVALCYKVLGINIPRNTTTQNMVCQKLLSGKELKPADVLFTAKKQLLIGYKITHVMLYIGNNQFIHATCEDGAVKKETCTDYFGCELSELNNCDITRRGKVFLGSFFPR